MSLLLKILISFLICAFSVRSCSISHPLIRHRRDSSCSITEDELKELQNTITSLYNASPERVISGCDKILTKAVVYANNLKDFLVRKFEDSDRKYNETKDLLREKENELLSDLERIPKIIQDRYIKSIDSTTTKIINLQKLIDVLMIENEKYRADIDYFNDILNNGTKYTTRFDDDSFFANAKLCTFRRDQVKKLITEFNEIFKLIVGIRENSPHTDCFEELRHQTMDIDSIVAHLTGDSKIVSLKSTYAERSRTIQKLIDDYTLVNHQRGRQNLSDVLDVLQQMMLNQTTLTAENDILKPEAINKGIQTVKMMIRSGTKLRKAKDIFLRIRKESPDMFKKVLDQAYDCDANYLIHTIRFAEINSKFPGFMIIKDKMADCKHLNSPFILYIADVTKDTQLDQNVINVYQGWTNQLQQGRFEQITKFMKQIDAKVFNFPKIFHLVLKQNRNNMKHLLDFISGLHAYDQGIITDLYNQIKELNLVDSNEHIQIAQWVRDKLNWIGQQPSQSAITGELQPHLEEIKEKLPVGIKVFVFEPSVILSMKDFAYLMRGDSHSSVKFKPTPDTTRKFYRFEDLRFGKAFYAEGYTDVNNYWAIRVRMGTGYDDKYYWSVIPTDNAQFFYLKNKANGNLLSAKEDNVCLSWFRNCVQFEWMNRAIMDNNDASTKWMFTDVLIRYGILNDRNQG